MKKNKISLINKVLTWYARFSGYKMGRLEDCTPDNISCIVIYSTTALGDLILNTPAINALRSRYPSAKFIIVSSLKNKELVHNSPLFDEVLYWDNKFKNILTLIFKLRRLHPQMAVMLHSYFGYDISTAVMAGCRYIFRDHHGGEGTALNHWLTGFSSPINGHMTQRKLNLLQPLGCDISVNRLTIPVAVPPGEKPVNKIRIGFQLGASRDFRRWPLEKFAGLCVKLMDDNATLEVVLIGGPNEKPLGNELMALIPADYHHRIISLVGKTGLKALASIITTFDTLVTGDTGPLHLAIAQQIRTVSLFVNANPFNTGPNQDFDLHQVIYKPISSLSAEQAADPFPMAAITVEEVFAAVRASYQRGRKAAEANYHYGT